MNLRFEAESRVERQRIQRSQQLERQSGINSKSRRPRPKINTDMIAETYENLTPKIAALAETDYTLNGRRARCDSDEFVGPRWIPNAESLVCFLCQTEFDWWTRRHHCRYCGKIYCGQCSYYRSLLPYAFGLRDPQRVCQNCHHELQPQQISLTNNIANHQRANPIDIVSYSLRRYMNFPISLTLGSEIRKAGYSTYNLCRQMYYIRDKTVPLGLLSAAKGIAYITVAKGGFMFAPYFGTGLVVARLPSGVWSAPSAIGTLGVSYGPLIGAEIVDYMIILSSDDAVSAFSSGGQIALKASADLAVGPLGRSGTIDLNFGDGGCAASYTYSHSRGLYAGISLEGSVIFSRSDVNHRFYGRVVTPTDLLRGNIPPPRAAQPLYDALSTALSAFTQPTYSCFTNPQISPLPASGQSSGKYGSQGPGSANLNFGLHGSSESGSAKSIEYFGVTARNEESFSTFDSTSSVPLSALSSQQSNRTFFSTDRRTR